jgi:hypothetical protein
LLEGKVNFNNRKGDFLLEINGKDVTKASHETVVTLIRNVLLLPLSLSSLSLYPPSFSILPTP